MSSATELTAWLNGVPTGGPNGDGRYPLTYADGLTYLVYCPEAQALNPALSEQPIEVFSNTASSAAATATAEADEAEAASITAQTAAANAAASATAANTAKVSAQTAATNAATSATAAAGSATEASGYVSTVSASASAASDSATAAALSVTNANTAKTAAETARDLANSYANAASGVQVEPGKYSAMHWALQASAALTGALMYKGTWNATTAYPAAPVTGHFYKVSVAGNATGVQYDVGDQIIYNGAGWDKVDNTELVTSVAGRVGPITLAVADVTGLQADLDAKVATNSAASLASLTLTGSITASGSISSQLVHERSYFIVKPYNVSYDDGSKIESYYDGNNRKWNLYARDSLNAVGDINMAFNGKTVITTGDLDGSPTPLKVAQRDGNGDVQMRLSRSTWGDEATISGAIAYRVNNGANNYTRFCNDVSAIRTFLGVKTSAEFLGYTTMWNGTNGLQAGAYPAGAYGGIWHSSLTPGLTNYAFLQNSAGTQTFMNASTGGQLNFHIENVAQMQVNETNVMRKNANSTTMTRQPRVFVQSADPGAAAADGDLWIW